MSIKLDIEADLKRALLAGDKAKVMTLKGVKAVVLEKEIEKNCRDQGLSDEDMVGLLRKEVKKRKETAEIYKNANDELRQKKELDEARIIEDYLPEQVSEEKVAQVVDDLIGTDSVSMQDMGRIIGQVKQKLGDSADGGIIAKQVKMRIER